MCSKIDRKWPWLKVGVIISICGIIFLCIETNAIFGEIFDGNGDVTPKSPLSRHVEVPDLPMRRNLDGKKLVALTFDDGPSSLTTPRLLDILAEKKVVATFFALGTSMRGLPDIVKREEAEGHEVGTHTMYHQQLSAISIGNVASDLNEARGVFNSVLGREPSIMRPPYGAVNNVVANVVNMPMILWSVDTLDWKDRNTNSIMKNVRNQVYDGAIILMHDIHATSVDAVPVLVDELRANGYEFVTVSELAEYRGRKLENGELYGGFRAE